MRPRFTLAFVGCLTTSLGCPSFAQAPGQEGDGDSEGGGTITTTIDPTSGLGEPDATSDAMTADDGDTGVSTTTPSNTSTGDSNGSTGLEPSSTGSTSNAETGGSSSGTGECVPSGDGAWLTCELSVDCGEGNTCVATNQGAGPESVCLLPCGDACDCPASPDTGNAVVTCGNVVLGDEPECHLACGADTTCPDGMSCFDELLCLYDNAEIVGYYEGCNSAGFDCPSDALCVGGGGSSTCVGPACDNAGECPNPPPGGTAACEVPPGLGRAFCFLSCIEPASCPDGWSCSGGVLCVQDDP